MVENPRSICLRLQSNEKQLRRFQSDGGDGKGGILALESEGRRGGRTVPDDALASRGKGDMIVRYTMPSLMNALADAPSYETIVDGESLHIDLYIRLLLRMFDGSKFEDAPFNFMRNLMTIDCSRSEVLPIRHHPSHHRMDINKIFNGTNLDCHESRPCILKSSTI